MNNVKLKCNDYNMFVKTTDSLNNVYTDHLRIGLIAKLMYDIRHNSPIWSMERTSYRWKI